MIPGPRNLGRLEFAGDQAAAAIVPQGRGEMQGRDAELGPELFIPAEAAPDSWMMAPAVAG